MPLTRLGLFGGTFDPVHNGHLQSAVELAERYDLNTLFLVPNHQPVHRDTPDASTDHRVEMLQLATTDVDRLSVDTREALRDGPSYTVDTLTAVAEEHPGSELLFFMGVDAFAQFDSWHRWETILTLAQVVVIDRPNAELSDFGTRLLRGDGGPPQSLGISRCTLTQLDISATQIRHRIAQGRTVKFLLPASVHGYIEQHGLYR
ncbi:MAG: nicotinate (nicotinamide) nucleotide adenylyltransferase [Gammaproteobacteria bacterium]|nr:nicotinate (nicotinamide) nucleotide adenylyltransferase [Gammaproteobacteria bacterium]